MQCAIFTTCFSLTSEAYIRFAAHTAANGVESSLAVMALYYYLKLEKGKVQEMAIMVIAITLAFIIRSSSLAPWIPLAILKFVEKPQVLMTAIYLAFMIALPLMIGSVVLDSLFYGRLTVPQANFVYINIF